MPKGDKPKRVSSRKISPKQAKELLRVYQELKKVNSPFYSPEVERELRQLAQRHVKKVPV